MVTPVVQPDPGPAAGRFRAGTVVDTLCRPMVSARAESEVQAAAPALRPWLTGPDVRLKAFAAGALWAFKWASGVDEWTPVTREPLASPNFREVLAECALAALVAEGVLPSPASGWSDAGRILARGAEVWLSWWLWPTAPPPALLTPGAPAGEVAGMLGDVGLGPAGLDGPSVSSARFPALPGARLLASVG
jgi:hypothetical protein